MFKVSLVVVCKASAKLLIELQNLQKLGSPSQELSQGFIFKTSCKTIRLCFLLRL